MTLAIATRLARRELRGGLGGFRIFLLCLTLGVGAIAAVGSVGSAIEAGLAREGRALLGGDAELELTYRFAGDAERAWLDENAAAWGEVVDFRSMAVGPDGDRALTQVKGIDANWPLVGEARFEPAMSVAQVLAGRDGLPGAALERVLIDRLGLEVGDTVRLGTQDFALMAALEREPDSVSTGFALGPRTLVGLAPLREAGLLGAGSMFETSYRLVLNEDDTLDRVRRSLIDTFHDAGIRWRDSTRAVPGVARFVDRIGAFLVLVGLAGLAVGGIGVSAAVRAYLDAKTGVIATLKTLGAEGRTIFAVYFLQIGALTLLGVGLGVALGAGALLVAAPFAQESLPVPLQAGIYWQPLGEAALYGVLTALVFTLWPLSRVEQVRAAALFRGIGGGTRARPRPGPLLALILSVAALIAAAVLFSGTWQLALGAALGIAGALAILSVVALALRALARRAARTRALRGKTALRLALGAVGNPREGAVAVVLSLGLGLTVLASVGQIDTNLRNAISTEMPDRAPSFFFLDIQPDQVDRFRGIVSGFEGVHDIQLAPQLRGVISQINDRPAREYGSHWVLRGDRGVTYAAEQGDLRLTQGEWWPQGYDGPPLISFGAEEGAELGLSLGDTITVNVMGRDITGTIANFRELDFSTGGIGFVMTFNPAAFAGAPHTVIATLRAPEGSEGAILRAVGDALPNVTAIPIRETTQRVAEALDALAAATSIAALATLATGFVVLIGAAAAGERARVFEAAVLKTVGATRGRILLSFALRSVLMGGAAGLVAIGAGGLAAWAVITQVMELTYRFAPGSALAVVVGGILAVLLAGLVFALRPLAARPAGILRAQE
ncbi:ABC transporter permease [Pararhodobacter marinus]|uniref:ABC transporter permease n=1 Tax=Pararhodobacter marinus TaxID=2184063 RepID=UPI0035184416